MNRKSDIMVYLKKNYKAIVGDRTAKDIIKSIKAKAGRTIKVKGRDIITGKKRSIIIKPGNVR